MCWRSYRGNNDSASYIDFTVCLYSRIILSSAFSAVGVAVIVKSHVVVDLLGKDSLLVKKLKKKPKTNPRGHGTREQNGKSIRLSVYTLSKHRCQERPIQKCCIVTPYHITDTCCLISGQSRVPSKDYARLAFSLIRRRMWFSHHCSLLVLVSRMLGD